MKTILVDAVGCLIISEEEGFELFGAMYNLLEKFENKKIILTGANDEQYIKFGLDKMPYEVFTLKHNPEKTNPEYYKKMLEHFNLVSDDVVYFEHDIAAVKSAESVGIMSYYYDSSSKNLESLSKFLNENI